MLLRFLKEFEEDETYEITMEGITIGRDTECEIVIHDDLVSRRHSRIIYDEKSYWVEDLNSTNGTYLNGIPVDRSPLKFGDKINIGKATLLVQDMMALVPSEKPAVHIIEADRNKPLDMLSIPSSEATFFLKEVEGIDAATLKRENETLKKIFEINNFLTSTRNVSVLIEKMLNLAFEMISADNVCILLPNVKTGDLDVRNMISRSGSQEVVVSRTIINHVLDKERSVLTSDAMDDQRFDPRKSIISANIKSVVCTPIRSGHTVGIFYADMRSARSRFTEDDLKIVTILANMIGIALENDFWHREAIRKERLSAIGEVITGISHYAKNIINGLRLAIQALEMSTSVNDSDKMEKSMKAIKAQEKRISNLVLNMLDYSKERVPVRQKVDLREVVQDITDPYLEFFQNKNIRFVFDIEEDFPEVLVDVTGIHRILLNLFTNALDAIKDTQEAMIRISVRLCAEKDAFQIVMEDNGTGINKKLLKRVFDVFYSSKNFEGTGLGLAVVKKTVEEHGGEVSLVSEPGQGARFTIKMPIEPG